MLMSKVVIGWLLLWQAGIARERLEALCREKGIEAGDASRVKALSKDNAEVAFYAGKVATAKYFIKNVLPEVESAAKAIRAGDTSPVEIAEESFAS